MTTTRLRLASALALTLTAGCAGVSHLGGPESRPAERAGWRVYTVGALTLEAPAGWEASGDGRRLTLDPPGGTARLEAWVTKERGAGGTACLAAAEVALKERDGEDDPACGHAASISSRSGLK